MRQAAAKAAVTVTAAAIYARQSSDNESGIDRQIEDGRALAAELGWPIAEIYVDDGISAADEDKYRTDYERLLADVRTGRRDGVIFQDLDRFVRQPREFEDWVRLARRGQVQVAATRGEVDLTSTYGVTAARVKTAFAEAEVLQLKDRMRRSLVQRAERGKAHGRTPYGWQPDLLEVGRRVDSRGVERIQRVRKGPDVIDPEAAEVIRSTARRLLAGESIYSIVADLNKRGVPTASGGKWTGQQLRTVMIRESNCGRRVHRGEVVGEVVDRPALLDEGTHDRVVALLTDPSRVKNPGRPKAHLLSLLAVCGKCADVGRQGRVTVNSGRSADPEKGRRAEAPGYVCTTCYALRKKQADVDAYVTEAVIARLQRADAAEALAVPDRTGEVAAAQKRIAALNARLDRAADSYADEKLTAAQLERITGKITPQIAELTATVRAAMPRADLAPMTGPDAAERWAAAPLDVKRALIDALMTVTLYSGGTGRKVFNPATVVIDWKRPDRIDF